MMRRVALVIGALVGLVPALAPAATATGTWTATQLGFQGWPAGSSLLRDGATSHVAFLDSAASAIRYATCTTSCDTTAGWSGAAVATNHELAWQTSIAREPSTGRLHIAWIDVDMPDFAGVAKYATCASSCTTAANWTTTTIRTVGDNASLSLAVAPGGTVHIAGTGRDPAGTGWLDVFYAACSSSCGSTASWTDTSLLPIGGSVVNPKYVSIDVDELGRPRFAYVAHVQNTQAHDTLFLASCDASCASASAWQHAALPTGFCCPIVPSLVLENGRGHVALQFFDTWPAPVPGLLFAGVYSGYGNLAYLSCASSCASASSWSPPTIVDLPANVVGPVLVVMDGKPRIAYEACVHCFSILQEDQGWLAACDSACTEPRSWGSSRIDAAGAHVTGLAMASDGTGLTIAFGDSTAHPTPGDPRALVTVADCASACTPPPDLLPFGAMHPELVAP